MKLNMPEIEGRNILIVGAGGGFDVYAGIPIAYELLPRDEEDPKSTNVVLANYSQRKPKQKFTFDWNDPELLPAQPSKDEDYPEGAIKIGLPVYTIGRFGMLGVQKALQIVVDKHQIDSIVVVDGGVDSLMRGDEEAAGTILEDFLVLGAVSQLEVVHKYLVCLGFGAETEEGLNHFRVLENIATLSASGHFLGSCSLTKDMKCFDFYERCCNVAWRDRRKSHIQSRIIPAVHGRFGDFRTEGVEAQVQDPVAEEVFVSPLMGIYWFFDLMGVVDNNLLIDSLKLSMTFTDAMMLFRQNAFAGTRRSKEIIPL